MLGHLAYAGGAAYFNVPSYHIRVEHDERSAGRGFHVQYGDKFRQKAGRIQRDHRT